MQFPQFDKMDPRDRGDFGSLLIKVAYNDLTARGETEQAEKLLSFFEDESDNEGFKQFDKNLELVREVNKKNADDPNNKTPPYEVEHAMALTLKHDGIQASVPTLLAGGKDFKAGGPPDSPPYFPFESSAPF